MRYRLHETGEERWALVRGPVHDDDGRVAYAINIFRDITDAQRAEEQQHAALALEYVADGVFLLDTDDVVRFWNRRRGDHQACRPQPSWAGAPRTRFPAGVR